MGGGLNIASSDAGGRPQRQRGTRADRRHGRSTDRETDRGEPTPLNCPPSDPSGPVWTRFADPVLTR